MALLPEAKVDATSQKQVWEPPKLSQLPRLTQLTLQTGGGIPGDGGGSSTVF